MATGASLTGSQRVRNLQTVLHAKAKEEPERRFHALYDKVWRKDFLLEAWVMARRNGGRCSATTRMRRRIASPEMLLWPRALPHVKCSPGRSLWEHWNEESEHDGTGRVG